MPAGIPTSNILQPGAISIQGGANEQLISMLQLLTPQYYKTYVEKYGNEDFTWWLATYGGMEQVFNQEFFWFENYGKLMPSIISVNAVNGVAAGANVVLTLDAGDHFNNGTESPLRINETVRISSSYLEGVIIDINDDTPFAFEFTVAPKNISIPFTSANSPNLNAGEVLIFGGYVDAAEASDSIEALIHLDNKLTNTVTTMRDTWKATDWAEMTQVFYENGVTGDMPVEQAGTSLFTYKGMVKTNMRFKNNVENKLMFGNVQNNTAINNSLGTQGMFPFIGQFGETVGTDPNSIDFAKMHEITRIMRANGCAKDNLWLQDVFQGQAFSDGIFNELPAGAFVWGNGEKSQEAAMAYGFDTLSIDNFNFRKKVYVNFNTEITTGHTPLVDKYRYTGYICPMGTSRDSRDSTKTYKNMTVMYQQPVGGGTVGNGIRVWQHGGGSRNPTDGKLNDNIEMVTYRGLRLAASNQFIEVTGN